MKHLLLAAVILSGQNVWAASRDDVKFDCEFQDTNGQQQIHNVICIGHNGISEPPAGFIMYELTLGGKTKRYGCDMPKICFPKNEIVSKSTFSIAGFEFESEVDDVRFIRLDDLVEGRTFTIKGKMFIDTKFVKSIYIPSKAHLLALKVMVVQYATFRTTFTHSIFESASVFQFSNSLVYCDVHRKQQLDANAFVFKTDISTRFCISLELNGRNGNSKVLDDAVFVAIGDELTYSIPSEPRALTVPFFIDQNKEVDEAIDKLRIEATSGSTLKKFFGDNPAIIGRTTNVSQYMNVSCRSKFRKDVLAFSLHEIAAPRKARDGKTKSVPPQNTVTPTKSVSGMTPPPQNSVPPPPQNTVPPTKSVSGMTPPPHNSVPPPPQNLPAQNSVPPPPQNLPPQNSVPPPPQNLPPQNSAPDTTLDNQLPNTIAKQPKNSTSTDENPSKKSQKSQKSLKEIRRKTLKKYLKKEARQRKFKRQLKKKRRQGKRRLKNNGHRRRHRRRHRRH